MEEPKTLEEAHKLLKNEKAIFLYREGTDASYLDVVNGEFIFATYDVDGMLLDWVVLKPKDADRLIKEKLKRDNV